MSDDGKRYDPVILAREFRLEGMRVQMEAVAKERVGIHGWGTIIEITAIAKIE